jgi:hypothetical protein
MAAGVLGSALACVLAASVQAPTETQHEAPAASPSAADVEARIKATDEALLAAMEARRTEIAQAAVRAEDKEYALAFLDRSIADLRSSLEK